MLWPRTEFLPRTWSQPSMLGCVRLQCFNPIETAPRTDGFFMARIFFINRFFFPDHSATSQMVSDLAFHLASCGHDIQVITSQQLYEDARASLPQHEVVEGVRIYRIPTTRFGRSGLVGRGFD